MCPVTLGRCLVSYRVVWVEPCTKNNRDTGEMKYKELDAKDHGPWTGHLQTIILSSLLEKKKKSNLMERAPHKTAHTHAARQSNQARAEDHSHTVSHARYDL